MYGFKYFNMSYKIDFHTHSIVSQDGGVRAERYSRVLGDGLLQYIAVTDHRDISGALKLRQQLGDKIIVGEEIKTQGGEIIGLYLSEAIKSGMTLAETIKAIKQQNGLVYIPHPFEQGRHGLNQQDMEAHKNSFDIIEVFNGRGWGRGKSKLAKQFAADNNIVMASSSDAHGLNGLARAYTIINEPPTRDNLVEQLRHAELVMNYSSLMAYLDPTINRLKKRFSHA